MLILDDEKRKNKRKASGMSARVQVHVDRLMTSDEVTTLNDFSALGAGFMLNRPVKAGRLVVMTMEMPRELRGYDFRKADYTVWGLVRRCIEVATPNGDHRYAVGVAFIGKTPPEDFNTNPNTDYELIDDKCGDGFWQVSTKMKGKEKPLVYAKQRMESRYEVPEEVALELMDDKGWAMGSEMTVTLNISRNGASVYSQLNADVGSVIRFSSHRNNVRLISIVRGKYSGQAGLSRLNLEFIDQSFPIELV